MSERIKAKLGEELYAQVTKIIKPNEFDLIEGFIPKIRFDEVNGKLKTATQQVADLEKLAGTSETLKQDLETLKQTHATAVADTEKKFTNYKKTSMVKELLAGQNAKHTELLMTQVDLEKLTIDTKGNLIGATEVLDSLKQNFSDLFAQSKPTGNDPTPSTPPTTVGDDTDWGEAIKQFI